jgi:hypothetical protein
MSCSNCEPGKYQPDIGQAVCAECPDGFWTGVTNAAECDRCDSYVTADVANDETSVEAAANSSQYSVCFGRGTCVKATGECDCGNSLYSEATNCKDECKKCQCPPNRCAFFVMPL